MKVYSMNIRGIDPDDEKWYKSLSEKRIEKIKRLKKTAQKAQSIGAELLLNYAVNNSVKMPVKWDIDENGKLYLTEHEGIYVNLSHSADYAVCAVSDKPIGVDIQYCRECDMKMAKRFFTAEEADFINNSKNKNSAFFEIWTKKESFLKAIGKGITMPLNCFSVLSDKIEYNGEVYSFREYSVSQSGYKLFICYLS